MDLAKRAAAKLGEAEKKAAELSAAAAAKAAELDATYQLSAKATELSAAASAKAAAVDQIYGLSTKAEIAGAAAKAKAAEIDETYGVSSKVAGAQEQARAKAAELDETHNISARASATQESVYAKAAEASAAADARLGLTELADELAKSKLSSHLPPPPTAEELSAYGATPGPCRLAEPLSPESGKVCVTGASGFIAMHLVSQLLAKGYTVVATVRSTSKAAQVVALGDQYPEKLTVVGGCDLIRWNSFDEAVKGCVAVFHTASPFYPAQDKGAGVSAAGFEELVVPAVMGTKNVLESCKASGSVKRVVVTASFACIVNATFEPDCTYSDDIWNVGSFPNGNYTRNPHCNVITTGLPCLRDCLWLIIIVELRQIEGQRNSTNNPMWLQKSGSGLRLVLACTPTAVSTNYKLRLHYIYLKSG